MALDYSAVPLMPDGRTAAETIEAVAAQSEAIRVPMGPRAASSDGTMMWHVFGADSGKPILLLFHGGSGSTTYPYMQERLDLFHAHQPDFQMNVIPGAGHWVAYEAADAFNRKLIEVLGR